MFGLTGLSETRIVRLWSCFPLFFSTTWSSTFASGNYDASESLILSFTYCKKDSKSSILFFLPRSQFFSNCLCSLFYLLIPGKVLFSLYLYVLKRIIHVATSLLFRVGFFSFHIVCRTRSFLIRTMQALLSFFMIRFCILQTILRNHLIHIAIFF